VSTRTALLIIDAQVGLLASAYRRDDVVTHITNLITKARATGTPVFYVQHESDEEGSPLTVAAPGWLIHPALTPQHTDLVVHKRSSDSFYETPLQEELDAKGVAHLIVAGLRTEMCVDTTSRRAVSLGYDVTLVADAHTTTDSATLTAAQMIAYHNEILDDFGNDAHVVIVKDARTIVL